MDGVEIEVKKEESWDRIRVIEVGDAQEEELEEKETPEILREAGLELVDCNLQVSGKIVKGEAIIRKERKGARAFNFWNGFLNGKRVFYLEVTEFLNFTFEQLRTALHYATESHNGDTFPELEMRFIYTGLPQHFKERIDSYSPRRLP